MERSIRVTHDVQFSETDMAGLVHFSNYYRYAERAEAALFALWGFPLITTLPPLRGFPRVKAHASFKAPLAFGDKIAITLKLEALTERALDWRFQIDRLDTKGPVKAATGGMRTVYVERLADGSLAPQRLPSSLYDPLRKTLELSKIPG